MALKQTQVVSKSASRDVIVHDNVAVAAPPSTVCPLCGGQDYLEFVCHGPHGAYTFMAKGKGTATAYPEGLAPDLGLYESLPLCVRVDEGPAEYGVVEYRFGTAYPHEYRQLVTTYGHRSASPGKQYSASAFLAATLGRLAREGALVLTWGKGTGYWSYNDPISYWARSDATSQSRLTWAQFAAGAGLDPLVWPL